jgi:CRISPR-associated protein Csx14
MKRPEPSFSVKLDVTNPGQFFACCGLLELAHRLWPGAQGWFEGNEFCVAPTTATDGIFQQIHGLLDKANLTEEVRGDPATRPVTITPLGITLDWWINERGEKTPFKLWAGQQTSLKIVQDLKNAFCRLQVDPLESLFNTAQPMTGRFGVDPRAAWNALDVGFSPNSQKMKVTTFPAVEFLAGVGLQGFRPVQNGRVFRYATWSIPLPAPVARAAVTGVLPAGEVLQYRFQISDRGSYGGFDYAIPINQQEKTYEQ